MLLDLAGVTRYTLSFEFEFEFESVYVTSKRYMRLIVLKEILNARLNCLRCRVWLGKEMPTLTVVSYSRV